jgi:hypothetical protein
MSTIATECYSRAVAITASNTINFDGSTYSASAAGKAIPCDAIFIGGIGGGSVVVVVFEDGSQVSFTCVVGQILPVRAIRVHSTGTTANLLVALYYV